MNNLRTTEGRASFLSWVYQLTLLSDKRSNEGGEVGQKNPSSCAFSFPFSELLWRFLYIRFAQMLFGGAYVCTDVFHSEDEVLLFRKHFGLSINNDLLPYLALSFWMLWVRLEVWCLLVTFIHQADEVALQQIVVCGQPQARVQLSMSPAPYTWFL